MSAKIGNICGYLLLSDDILPDRACFYVSSGGQMWVSFSWSEQRRFSDREEKGGLASLYYF